MIEGLGGGSDERLRRIETLTDTSLSQLDPDDMLDKVLDRVRDILRADTAAILLLDPHAQQLVATAAKGLEQEVRDGFRLAVGRGFAGRVAADKHPVTLYDIGPQDVASPVLLQAGLRSLLGVPMFAAGDVIGVLHVGSRTRRRFTPDDIRLLQIAADRASAATQARATSIDRTAALALQRSLLPTRPSDALRIDIATRYIPGHASGVGGDWYDVFTLPTGWLGIVVGDVSGHGLRAAVVMGRLRSALRAYTLVSDSPAHALTLLDRKVHHFEAGNLATVLYANISPDRSLVRISLAGHLRPVLATPNQPAAFPDVPVDPPLGLGGRPGVRRSIDLPFPPGAVLVAYTDGLVERRNEIIDTGLERLRTAVTAAPAEQVCATVMAELAEEQPDDDIALLAIRAT
ncbi:PP2C family protein-serine/threonine phosphatase [Phytohabitans suffuscus]|uniref:Cyclic diguanylate phosphodiesterase n=1 Tax=Phytohabitans suffuscus TaxID=624315 RepID=A0A6F8YT84_9ACTN|nr:GAF domain-containing SpoIIE family protein phosphatase [Phytohabitans suffuscus]BCB89266.1 cyclic diguanylate phosphodiesterase [Phytohabitans suffuscus]